VIHSGDITGAAALLSLHQRFGCTRRKKASRFGVGSLLSVGLNWTVDTRGQGKLCFACTGSPPPRAGLASPSAGPGIPSAKTLNRQKGRHVRKKKKPTAPACSSEMEHDGEMAPPIPSHANAADADAAADDWAARDDFEESPAGSHSHPPAAAAAAVEAPEEAPLAPPAEGISGPCSDFLLRRCVVAGSQRWI
jgi:hypothetical protein